GEVESCAGLGEVEWVNPSRQWALSQPPAYTVEVQWPAGLSLQGYDLLVRDGTLRFTLYWQVIQPPGGEVVRFVHVLDAAGQIIGQSDMRLENQGVPPSAWLSGEYIMDSEEISLPAGCTPAKLRLGLYWPESGERLPLTASPGVEQSEHSILLPLP
ncbi:MAG: hypothetical protein ACUVWB_11035, partial [Anaerolineae bacterium]